uniref:Uncharacterized protein n=1 Tax=Parasteatoda tepidariorum TaxID=114398 RepID=A0A2L2Y8L2_PARTP
MVVNVAEAIEFVKDLTQNQQVRNTVQGSVKGGLIVGGAATLGAICLGPVGLAVGGAVGGIGAAIAAKDTFRPLPEVVADMSPQDKQRLACRVERFVQDFNVTDIASLGVLIAGNERLRERLVGELIQYLTTEMQVAIA